MRVFSRTIPYAALLIGFLVYLSYKLHSSPAQVERRLEKYLSGLLDREVTAEGCRSDFLDCLQVKVLTIPAYPVQESRVLLSIQDLHIDAPPRAKAFRRLFRKEKTAETPVSPRIHAAKATLTLEHKTELSTGTPAGAWNFGKVLRQDEAFRALEESSAQILVDRMAVEIRAIRAPRPELSWHVDLEDVLVRSAGPGLISADAYLAVGAHCSAGSIHLILGQKGELRGRAEIDGFRGIDRFVPLFDEKAQKLWLALDPASAPDLVVDEVRVSGGRLAEFKATILHYDATLRLGLAGIELEHLSGPMQVTPSGYGFKTKAFAESGFTESQDALASAELWGLRVQLAGSLGLDQGTLRVKVPRATLRDAFTPGRKSSSGLLVTVFSALDSRSSLEGELSLSLQDGVREAWKGSFQFSEVSFPSFPLCKAIRGGFDFERTMEEGKASAGQGKIRIDEILFSSMESARGELKLTWDEHQAHLEAYDLRVGEAPAGQAARAAGSFFGSLTWNCEAGTWQFGGRWMGVALSTGLFRAQETNGEFRSAPGEPPGGTVNLHDVTVPANLLGPGSPELSFETGRCVLEEGEKEIVVRSLKLLGPKRSLRGMGRLTAAGAIELVVLLDEGPNYLALHSLPDGSPPGRWKETSGTSFRAFRLSGSFSAPQAREIGAMDPAFVVER
jgi:hypothetical protein